MARLLPGVINKVNEQQELPLGAHGVGWKCKALTQTKPRAESTGQNPWRRDRRGEEQPQAPAKAGGDLLGRIWECHQAVPEPALCPGSQGTVGYWAG